MSGLMTGRRGILAGAAGLAGCGLGGGDAHAQATTPAVERVARTIVGFPPGGSSDIIARLYAERLRGVFAPQVIVENRSGAGGRVAVEAVKAAADGTTILQTPASMLTIYPHLYPTSLRYDALADFVPVTTVCTFPFALAVRADHPAKTLAEFITWAKAQGGAVPFASPAAGSVPHFLGVLLARSAGLQLTHVPYRGAAPAVQDLLAGQIPAVVMVLGDVSEFHRAGQARALAVSAPTRVARMPDVPTFAELGHPTLTAEEWFGLLLPARTPQPVVDALYRAVTAAAATTEMRDALARLEYAPTTMAPDVFAARIRQEREMWGPVVAQSGFRPDE